MPRDGYTAIVEKILAHDAVTVSLSTPFARADVGKYEHVFYTGPIDAWFDHSAGRLGYRTLDFEVERHEGDYQGNAVINYGDQSVPWTRISEHKHFAPWESHEKTLIFKEFSRACEAEDTPYYPIRMVKDKGLLEQYVQLARQEAGVTFLGRLGTYRYLDMHVAIAEALNTAQTYLQARGEGAAMPVFVNDPLA
jgi:UDP-galactopyranose mutase